MSSIIERLVTALSVSVLVLAIAQPESSSLLLAGIATLAVVTALGARYVAVGIRSLRLTVGARAHAHRESFSSIPEPSHPDTAGRTRARAPSQSPLAA